MTIDDAVESLQQKLGDDEVFEVFHDGSKIIVNVVFIYRAAEVRDLGDQWEGFPLRLGRRSCW